MYAPPMVRPSKGSLLFVWTFCAAAPQHEQKRSPSSYGVPH